MNVLQYVLSYVYYLIVVIFNGDFVVPYDHMGTSVVMCMPCANKPINVVSKDSCVICTSFVFDNG